MFFFRVVPLLSSFASAAGAPEATPFLWGHGDDDELHPRHAGTAAAKFGTAIAAAVSKATEGSKPPEMKAVGADVDNLANPRPAVATQSSTAKGDEKKYEYMGEGWCLDSSGEYYSWVSVALGACDYDVHSAWKCYGFCRHLPTDGAPALRGFEFHTSPSWSSCDCLYDATPGASFVGDACTSGEKLNYTATGRIASALFSDDGPECYAFNN